MTMPRQFRLRSLFFLTAIASELALFIGAARQPDERLGAAIVGGLALVALWMCIAGFMPPGDASDCASPVVVSNAAVTPPPIGFRVGRVNSCQVAN